MASWKERRDKLRNKTKENAQNREGKTSSVLTYKDIGDRDVLWADKPQAGRSTNKYDHLPFVVSNPDYANMRKFSGKPTNLEVGDIDYKLEYSVHATPTGEKFLCLKDCFGEPCGGCEEVERLYDENDPDTAGQLRARWRCLYNLIDLNADDEIRLWDYSYHNYEKTLLTEVIMGDEGLDMFWDLEEGKTVEWRGDTKTLGKNKFIQAGRIDFVDRDPYEESILDETYPLDLMFVKPTYEQTVRMITGMPAEEDTSKESNKSSGRSGRSSRSSRFNKDEATEDDVSPENENQCSQGREFGVDFNQHPECQNCEDDEYNRCQAENENPPEPKQDEPEPEKETSTRRRSNKSSSSDDDKSSGGRRRRRSR